MAQPHVDTEQTLPLKYSADAGSNYGSDPLVLLQQILKELLVDTLLLNQMI